MTTALIDETKVRETAYLMWLDEGQPDGRDAEHWLKAIDALTPAKTKKTAKSSAKARAAKPKAEAAAPKKTRKKLKADA